MRHPNLLCPPGAFTGETATQVAALVLTGVFDAHPGLDILAAHGEGLPVLLWRISHGPARR